MTDDEKSALLAMGLLGWRSRCGEAEPMALYWADTDGVFVYADSRAKCFAVGVEFWKPYANITQAKQVQAAMVTDGWEAGLSSTRGTGCCADFYRIDPVVGYGVATRPTEAHAICDAAGLALGLWGDDD